MEFFGLTGYWCPNPRCHYFKITDAQVHALVGDGFHYGTDTIQYLRCQVCHTKFSVRLGTPMYDLKTPARRVDKVMTATSEGVDVSAASRIFKHDERTIQCWLARTAADSQRLHHYFFHDLVCQHLQLDELVTKRRGLTEHIFVWVALDAQTKVIPVIRIGRRKHDDAMAFVHEVWQCLSRSPKESCRNQAATHCNASSGDMRRKNRATVSKRKGIEAYRRLAAI